jgi:hypothetical protein
MRAWAICAKHDVEYGYVGSFVDGPATYTDEAPCQQAGDTTTGVGVSTDINDLRINSLFPRPGGDTYVVGQAQVGDEPEGTVYFFAACAPPKYAVRYRDAAVVKVGGGEAGKVIAKCKNSEAVGGGGLAALERGTTMENPQYAEGTWTNATRPWDSKGDDDKVPDDGWLVRAHNGSGDKVDFVARAAGVQPVS